MRPTRRCAIWCGHGRPRFGCSAKRANICKASCCAMGGFMRGSTPGPWPIDAGCRRCASSIRPSRSCCRTTSMLSRKRSPDVDRLTQQIEELLPNWSMAPVVAALQVDARGRPHRGGHRRGGSRRLPSLRQSPPADGLSRPGAERALVRELGSTRRHHQGRQRLGAARADRGRLDLPNAGSGQPQAARSPRAVASGDARHRLEGAAAACARDIGAWPLPARPKSW